MGAGYNNSEDLLEVPGDLADAGPRSCPAIPEIGTASDV